MIHVGQYVCDVQKCVGGIRGPNTRMLKVIFGRLKPTYDTRVIHFDYNTRAPLAWTKKKRSLRNGKQTELQILKTEKRKAEDKT